MVLPDPGVTAVQLTVALPLPAVAVGLAGALGGEKGVIVSESLTVVVDAVYVLPLMV
jgi:hypothetical protein